MLSMFGVRLFLLSFLLLKSHVWCQRSFLGMNRGDSMILTFHVPPLARGQGLDSLCGPETFRKILKKGSPGTAKLDR